MTDEDEGGVDNRLVYQQAMETFRAILAQVVSTAGVLATACVVVVGIAVERDSPELVAVAAAFPVAIHLLFRRWRKFDETTLGTARKIESASGLRNGLAQGLGGWCLSHR